MLLWIFGLAKARAGKGYQNRERESAWFSRPKATPFRRLACVEISMGSPMLTSPGSTDTTKLRSSPSRIWCKRESISFWKSPKGLASLSR